MICCGNLTEIKELDTKMFDKEEMINRIGD
jgi:hypothetical protein